MKECSNTVFKPKTVLLASRNHLCVNEELNEKKGTDLSTACSNARKAKPPKCGYFRGSGSEMPWEPIDIEEIHKHAKIHSYCPYYTSKERVVEADLVLMPYNYLIDAKLRGKIDLENAIIIVDEAHNIAPCCEEVSSFELKSLTLQKCLFELQELQNIHDLQET